MSERGRRRLLGGVRRLLECRVAPRLTRFALLHALLLAVDLEDEQVEFGKAQADFGRSSPPRSTSLPLPSLASLSPASLSVSSIVHAAPGLACHRPEWRRPSLSLSPSLSSLAWTCIRYDACILSRFPARQGHEDSRRRPRVRSLSSSSSSVLPHISLFADEVSTRAHGGQDVEERAWTGQGRCQGRDRRRVQVRRESTSLLSMRRG